VSPSLLWPHAFGGPQHPRRFSPPSSKGCSSGGTSSLCFLWYFLVHTLYTLVNIFLLWVLYSSLSLCLSISCIRTAYLQSHSVFLFILGERTGSLLGIIFLYISDFYISIFSHPSYSCFPCSILSHTVFLLGAYSVCVHHDSVFCVCTLCFSTPYVWRTLYLEGHIYFEGHIYLEAYICLEGSSLV
jgi:hypothetical protein